MPRISAPTVAEHRAAQMRVLLDAARSLLAETGRPPTFAALAERAGLARPSLYQYFRSADDLLLAMVEDVFPRWSATVARAMDAAPDDRDRVVAYVRANLELVAQGEHALATALATIGPTNAVMEGSRAMHDELVRPLGDALQALGARDAARSAELVNAVVNSASRMIEFGTPLDDVWSSVEELVAPFLDRLADERGDAQGLR
ncbi:TetR/AcrR family transcriptional regulator [Oerskovia merdavium]|uniref:TetR/AcrR family transcriptional regulator n=1 Tax=Oerskovia merdavium TaxID=2762227 RepID=A0ABR8TWU3_9CELL|nr:TetR/AcrR family transcriptional regulator [Oerskovia merdavium]MBD7980074.1 TetR/AcrR family transcriptional regulator [Oerskovia merdavium]